jgi:hypothetical protein
MEHVLEDGGQGGKEGGGGGKGHGSRIKDLGAWVGKIITLKFGR